MTELLLAVLAQAQDPAGEQAAGPSPLIMMMLMFVVIYFMLIRPQQKQQKELKTYREALSRGDKIVTTGGIYGTVQGLTDDVVILEVAKDTRIRILRTQISGAQKTTEGSAAGAASNTGKPKPKGKAKAR